MGKAVRSSRLPMKKDETVNLVLYGNVWHQEISYSRRFCQAVVLKICWIPEPLELYQEGRNTWQGHAILWARKRKSGYFSHLIPNFPYYNPHSGWAWKDLHMLIVPPSPTSAIWKSVKLSCTCESNTQTYFSAFSFTQKKKCLSEIRFFRRLVCVTNKL